MEQNMELYGTISLRNPNPLLDSKILAMSNLKPFTDDKLNVTQNIKPVFYRVENIMGEEENASFQYFSPFPTIFSKGVFSP